MAWRGVTAWPCGLVWEGRCNLLPQTCKTKRNRSGHGWLGHELCSLPFCCIILVLSGHQCLPGVGCILSVSVRTSAVDLHAQTCSFSLLSVCLLQAPHHLPTFSAFLYSQFCWWWSLFGHVCDMMRSPTPFLQNSSDI